MEPHFHFGIEHLLYLFIALSLLRYAVKLSAAKMASAGGFLGQAGLAVGGILQ